jgi:hypothetical protein
MSRCARPFEAAEELRNEIPGLTEDRIELDIPSDGTHLPAIASWYWGVAVSPA